MNVNNKATQNTEDKHTPSTVEIGCAHLNAHSHSVLDTESPKRVPKLRFKEFSGDWVEKNLGYLIKSLDAGVSVNSTDKAASGSEKSILKTSCVSCGIFDVNENKLVLEENEIQRLKEPVKANTIIMSRMNTPALVGANAFVEKDYPNVFLPDRLWAAKIKDTASPKWTSILTASPKIRTLLSARATGTSNSMKNITKGDVLTLPVLIPSKQEQQKIADCLSTWDQAIENLKALIEQKKFFKKGMMQKLFSQEIRFKADDGGEFPAWVERKLGELGEFKTSSVDKKIVEGEKLVHLVNYMNVYKHDRVDNETINSYMKVSAKDYQIEASGLKKGDILFTPSSETPDDIGHSVVILEDLESTVYSYHLIRFRPKVALDIMYSHYFCNIPRVLKQITRVATGSTRFTVSVGEFSKVVVNLPCAEEQTKIANFLSAIDEEIELLEQELSQLELQKKGLMQGMFV